MSLAIVVSLVLVLAAPLIGEARRYAADRLSPGQYLWLVNGIVAAAVVGVGVAVSRIRDGWVWRYGLIAVAAVVAVTFTWATGNARPAVAAVEHFHFVQYGVITGLFYRAWRPRRNVASLVLPSAAAFVCGVAEEWWQWFLPARVGELQDVLLNGVAVFCGLLVSVALAPVTLQNTPASRRAGAAASLRGLVCVVAAVAAFTWTVHVGYAIEDTDIGMFRSRYSASTLHALSAARAARWAVDPPLIRRTLTREDQYRSEGEAHVRARNTAWDAGDVIVAWKENLILEKYYAPVLDTPSHLSATGHRWHPDHRADAERRAKTATAAAPFVSAAAVDTRWVLGS
jgi:VanZ family protein